MGGEIDRNESVIYVLLHMNYEYDVIGWSFDKNEIEKARQKYIDLQKISYESITYKKPSESEINIISSYFIIREVIEV